MLCGVLSMPEEPEAKPARRKPTGFWSSWTNSSDKRFFKAAVAALGELGQFAAPALPQLVECLEKFRWTADRPPPQKRVPQT